MSRIMNWMMGEAEAGRFEFREPPDYPEEAEYYGCGITWGQAREMLDNEPLLLNGPMPSLMISSASALSGSKKRTSFNLSWMKFLSKDWFFEGPRQRPSQRIAQ